MADWTASACLWSPDSLADSRAEWTGDQFKEMGDRFGDPDWRGEWPDDRPDWWGESDWRGEWLGDRFGERRGDDGSLADWRPDGSSDCLADSPADPRGEDGSCTLSSINSSKSRWLMVIIHSHSAARCT